MDLRLLLSKGRKEEDKKAAPSQESAPAASQGQASHSGAQKKRKLVECDNQTPPEPESSVFQETTPDPTTPHQPESAWTQLTHYSSEVPEDPEDREMQEHHAWSSSSSGLGMGGMPASEQLLDRNRPFFCDRCLTAFSSRSNLQVHNRTVHDRLRPYTCRTCNFPFGTKSNRNRHEKMVHRNERYFTCPYCNKAFGTRSCVRRHVLKLHGDGGPSSSHP